MTKEHMVTLTDPGRYTDKTVDWLELFSSLRVPELRELATEQVLDEHARDPRGTSSGHSDELQQLLNFARGLPITAKIFVHAVEPHQRYRLARMVGRGEQIQSFGEDTYETEREAVHAALVARLTEQGVLPASQEVAR
jgi:hypothetical protein